MTSFTRRFVQTFWTDKQSMTDTSFGWINPESHLMSWLLSSYSLKENAEELVLYTDTEGARILIDTLHLPYTEVHVCYDHLNCPSVHWAIPKMLTYSKQDKPFVHVDADLYLPSGLPHEKWMSPLLTQNQESGTPYYKQMMNYILYQNPVFPDYLIEELRKESIGSYCAGIFGGTDIPFIQKYCGDALKVIHDNGWMQRDCSTANVNQNLLFEQLLFYALTKKEGKKVDTLLDKIIGDNQYTFDVVCDFFHYDSTPFIHMLGSYKRNEYVCDLMQKMAAFRYPSAYEQIIRMFPQKYPRASSAKQRVVNPQVNLSYVVLHYERHINKLLCEWGCLPADELLKLEHYSAKSVFAYEAFAQEEKSIRICSTPYLNIYSYPKEFPHELFGMIAYKFGKRRYNDCHDIAIHPTFKGNGYKEALINDLQYNILISAKSSVTFPELVKRISPRMHDIIDTQHTAEDIIKQELKYLVMQELVHITTL